MCAAYARATARASRSTPDGTAECKSQFDTTLVGLGDARMTRAPTRARLTRTGTSTATTVRVRGRDLVNELIGNVHASPRCCISSPAIACPTPQQVRLLDACLVTLMEHGLTPGAVIARLMADSVPEEPQVAIASGLLAIGSVYAGTTETCAALLLAMGSAHHRPARRDAAAEIAREHADKRKRPVPGFGHGTHKPDDPRTARLFADRAQAGPRRRLCCDAAIARRRRSITSFGRHITINATGAIGALLLGDRRAGQRHARLSRSCPAPEAWSATCSRSTRPSTPGGQFGPRRRRGFRIAKS